MPGNTLFDFGKGWVTGLGVKRAPSKYDYSKPRFWNHEGDGIAISSFWPNRFLPCRMLDKTTERAVVIPMGTIVAARSFPANNTNTSAVGEMTEFGIDSDGKLLVGGNWDGGDVNLIDANSYFGYQEEQEAMITIANGGLDVADYYNEIDVQTEKLNPGIHPTTGAWDPSTHRGSAIAAGNRAPLRALNRPTGLVIQDVWEDIRGRHLNYEQPTQQGVSIQRICRIKIPYIVDVIGGSVGPGNTLMQPTAAYTDPGNSAGYMSVRDLFQFITLPAAVRDNPSLVEGVFCRPDILGKFALWSHRWANAGGAAQTTLTAWDALDDANSASANLEPAGGWDMLYQKVGRIQSIDRRFPKAMLEYVDTYPGSRTTGTDTGGLIQELFFFVDSIQRAMGNTLTRQQIVNLVRDGYAGFVYIQLDVI